MKLRLIQIDGQWRDETLSLDGRTVTLGRDSSSPIPIADSSVSRAHCVFEPSPDGYRLRDLESRNGTFVNGAAVSSHELRHGDRIDIGRVALLYLEDESAPPLSADLDDCETTSLAPVQREGADTGSLLRIGTAVQSIQSLYAARDPKARLALEKQLLALIAESVPAGRGAIVLNNEAGECPEPPPWCRAVIEGVMASGEAVLEDEYAAVPLSISAAVFGAIYLDSPPPGTVFTEEHLALLTSIAGIASMAIENARYVEWLGGESRRSREEVEPRHDMVGESAALERVTRFVSRVAPTDSTVLIRGESGTGKELVARAIHKNSSRSQQPFVAINCAALTDTLLESEFFGYEKGAFTGAFAQKKGKLEAAEGGTVFLDEIGELAQGLQAKLLRVLQERAFERVGGTRSIPVDVRVVAATNRDLAEAIREGKFRLDLFYRLNVVAVTLPPLRERRQDIPLLARYFAGRICTRMKRPVARISPEALACLSRYEWPGNIRELENAIEHAIVLGAADLIRPEDLPLSIVEGERASRDASGKYQDAVQDTKRQAILKAIEQTRGNVTAAAKLLGVHPNYLHRLIRNLDLRQEMKKFA